LRDVPDDVAVDLMQLQLAEIWIELATDPLYIRKASQVLLAYEIPDYRFLPGTLGLDAQVNLAKRLDLQLGEDGFGFASVFSPSALAYALAVRKRCCNPPATRVCPPVDPGFTGNSTSFPARPCCL
jgi:hypothetical protein